MKIFKRACPNTVKLIATITNNNTVITEEERITPPPSKANTITTPIKHRQSRMIVDQRTI